jgi:hypothetical protein
MSVMLALDLRNREFEYFQYTDGLLDEQTWLAYRHVILINHSTGRGRVWWDEIGREIVAWTTKSTARNPGSEAAVRGN